MFKAAVTGGLSSGKSSVCHFFQQLGAKVESADRIVHELLIPDSPLGKSICELLGDEVLKGSSFDRTLIASKVFAEPQLLHQLEGVLHPEVRREIQKRAEGDFPLYVVEVPLLYEASFEGDFDRVIAVVSDQKRCRDRFGPGYELRMERQISMKEKADRADYVITNNGSKEELQEATKQIYQQLTK